MKKLLAAMALLVACGTDSVSSDQFAQAYRDAFCRNFVKCGSVKDLDTCRKLSLGPVLDTVHVTASGQAVFDMGKAGFDGGKAQACIDAIANADCDVSSASQRPLLEGLNPDVCSGIVTGK